jgi:hypothetical protein
MSMRAQVVAARLTPSQRDLVVWGWVPPHAGDPDSFAFFTATVVNIQVSAGAGGC